MIGMPARAIVLEIGIGVEVICENRSAVIPIVLPQRNDPGIVDLWADVFHIVLAMCGAAIPTKPIGPQNAVTVPVITQQLISALALILCGRAPERTANSSPNRIMSSPLLLDMASADPSTRATDMIMISLPDVVEKLPAAQLWNILRLSASLPD